MTGPPDTDPPAVSGSDDPGYYEALGRAIRVLRTERGLERKDLAEAAGLSYPYVSEIETGRKRPSSKALFVISEALGVRPAELLALGDRYVGRTAGSSTGAGAGTPTTAHVPSPAPAVMQPSDPLVAPAAAPPRPTMARARAAGSAAHSGRWRWFERPVRLESALRADPAAPAEPGPDAVDAERRRVLDALAEAAAQLPNDDLAALLDLARRLGR